MVDSRLAEIVSASQYYMRRFRNKFGMTSIVTLLICFLLTFSAKAQIPTITFTGTGKLTQSIVNAEISGITAPFKVEINGYTAIDTMAFSGLTDLHNPLYSICRNYLVEVIASDVIDIYFDAFRNCMSLVSASFPSATTIERHAFQRCNALESITLGAVPPTLGDYVFSDDAYGNNNLVANITLHIPAGSRGDYETNSHWSGFFLPTLLFAAVEEYCSLSIIISGSGSVVTSPLATAYLPFSSAVSLTATPDPCYQFVNWTSDNGFSSTDNPLDIVVINDTTLTANFIAVTPRTFSVISGNTAMGTVDYAPSGGVKTGSYSCNTPIIATATPVSKYRFIGWYENNVLVSKASPYIFNITSNRTLVGRFEKKPPARIKKINVKKGRLRIKPQP